MIFGLYIIQWLSIRLVVPNIEGPDPGGQGLPFAKYPTHIYHLTFIAK
jgi:hypothetical protein